VEVFDTFTIHLSLSGVPDPGLIAWTHDVVLDSLVQVLDVDIKGDFGGEGKIVDDELEMSGLLNFGATEPTGDVDLANITFRCIGFGETDLTQAWHLIGTDQNFVLADLNTLDLAMGWTGTGGFDPLTIHVNQVSIPGTLLLLGSGLVGIMLFRTKRFGRMV
jgi:hypothetical protein